MLIVSSSITNSIAYRGDAESTIQLSDKNFFTNQTEPGDSTRRMQSGVVGDTTVRGFTEIGYVPISRVIFKFNR